jgi:hypothetical protein
MSVELHPQYLYDEEGKPKMVLLSYAEYVAVLEELEDLQDAATLAERVRNAGEPEALEDVVRELS